MKMIDHNHFICHFYCYFSVFSLKFYPTGYDTLGRGVIFPSVSVCRIIFKEPDHTALEHPCP